MNEHSLLRRLIAVAALAALVGCGGKSSNNGGGGSGSQGKTINFSNTVFIGDSLTAGFQSGSLVDTSQVHGWAPLVAQQANFPITLPLIAPPGAPAQLQLISLNPLVIQAASGTTTGRDNFAAQPTDLAVPGHTLKDALSTVPKLVPTSGEDIITQLVLGYPQFGQGVSRSQVDEAVALRPTTIFVWIGNNDALVADITGDPNSMTPIADFTSQFTELTTKVAATGATVIFLNIPDVTAVPYLQPAATVLAQTSAQSGLPVATLSVVLGIKAGDFVNPAGLGEIPGILSKLANGQQAGPISADGVLTAAETAQAQATVQAYNGVITAQAALVGAAVVDVNGLFSTIKANGITVDNFHATADFLGGLFSLDGIHPTNTGYALVANRVIDALDTRYALKIPDVDVNAVAAADPLFPPNLKPVTPAAVPASVNENVGVLFHNQTHRP